MPNYCECDLEVSGEKVEFDKLISFIKSEDSNFDFNKVIPYPEAFKKLDKIAEDYIKNNPDDYANAPKDGFNQGGYEWCLQNWGTKWRAGDVSEWELESPFYDENYISGVLTFKTAWSPPIPIIEKLIELFPALKIELRYYEAGCAFQGILNKSANITCDYYGIRGG